jgi:hypothetical protein
MDHRVFCIVVVVVDEDGTGGGVVVVCSVVVVLVTVSELQPATRAAPISSAMTVKYRKRDVVLVMA